MIAQSGAIPERNRFMAELFCTVSGNDATAGREFQFTTWIRAHATHHAGPWGYTLGSGASAPLDAAQTMRPVSWGWPRSTWCGRTRTVSPWVPLLRHGITAR